MNEGYTYESVHRDTLKPITIFHYKNHYGIHKHWHEHLEILYFIKGHAIIHCGQNIYDAHDNDIIIINSNELHKSDYMEPGTEYYCFVISPSFFSLSSFNKYAFETHIPCNDFMKNILNNITKEFSVQEIGYETHIKGELYTLLIYLLRSYTISEDNKQPVSKKMDTVNKVNSIVQFINENYFEDLNISDLAKQIFCSESYLQHIFKKEIGKNITEYINQTRINASIKFLRLNQLQIKEISNKVGFSDYNYFSRIFKKYTGMTPIEYRKKNSSGEFQSKKNIYSDDAKNYDLTLPDWGPYNKEYAGFSHIANKKKGLRFDIDIFPGFFRRSVINPVTISDNGAKAWASSPDFSHTVYRYELEWKDNIYCDVHMLQNDGNCRLLCEYVNNSDSEQGLQTNFVFSLRLPTAFHVPFDIYTVKKNEKTTWINAVNYSNTNIKKYVAPNGLKLGEEFFLDFSDGNGISEKYFYQQTAYFEYNVNNVMADSIGIRYTAENTTTLDIMFNDFGVTVTLQATKKPKLYSINIDKMQIHTIKLINNGYPVSIDGIAIGIDVSTTEIIKESRFFKPEITKNKNSMTLKYPHTNHTYNINWDFNDYFIREFHGDNIGNMLINSTHNHVQEVIEYNQSSHFTDLFLRPIFLKPHSRKTITIDIKTNSDKSLITSTNTFSFQPNRSGEKYLFSQNLMAAVTMMNVVYPIYCRGSYIKHNTPGKNWDSLYTWDSGFTGLGLLTIDKTRAIDCLNTYITSLNDTHSPFILHGTPLATQVLLYQEILNFGNDVETVKQLYPYMKQFYTYFSNLHNSEKQPSTGLLNTWHLFYNSGGWDDYPPQKYIHKHLDQNLITPIISTSFTILFAKIMQLICTVTDNQVDLEQYSKDIEIHEKALDYAWDDESGYFGYVVHDKQGNKKDILRTEKGENYNKGMDGIYPYISSSTSLTQNKKIFDNIKNNLLTKYGVSMVDTKASYFSDSGYWNGSIWMPHQWILWKSLLDHNEIELANHIAETALNLWKEETSETYNCFEHFMLKNGRGAGFHQFSGLSTPVLLWFKSYHIPGTISTGLFTIVKSQKWNKENSSLKLKLHTLNKTTTVIICMNDKFDYEFDGVEKITRIHPGTYALKITTKNNEISVSKNNIHN